MCGRYVLAFECEHYLGNVQVGADIYNFNVAPTNTVPILVDHMVAPTLFDSAGGGAFPNTELYEREIHLARWGLLPSWAKDASYSARAFNARSETVFENLLFGMLPQMGIARFPLPAITSGRLKLPVPVKLRRPRILSIEKMVRLSTLLDFMSGGRLLRVKLKNPILSMLIKLGSGF